MVFTRCCCLSKTQNQTTACPLAPTCSIQPKKPECRLNKYILPAVIKTIFKNCQYLFVLYPAVFFRTRIKASGPRTVAVGNPAVSAINASLGSAKLKSDELINPMECKSDVLGWIMIVRRLKL